MLDKIRESPFFGFSVLVMIAIPTIAFILLSAPERAAQREAEQAEFLAIQTTGATDTPSATNTPPSTKTPTPTFDATQYAVVKTLAPDIKPLIDRPSNTCVGEIDGIAIEMKGGEHLVYPSEDGQSALTVYCFRYIGMVAVTYQTLPEECVADENVVWALPEQSGQCQTGEGEIISWTYDQYQEDTMSEVELNIHRIDGTKAAEVKNGTFGTPTNTPVPYAKPVGTGTHFVVYLCLSVFVFSAFLVWLKSMGGHIFSGKSNEK